MNFFSKYNTTDTNKNKIFVRSPDENQLTAINGVWIEPDEEVIWNLNFIGGKTMVNGYMVTKKRLKK